MCHTQCGVDGVVFVGSFTAKGWMLGGSVDRGCPPRGIAGLRSWWGLWALAASEAGKTRLCPWLVVVSVRPDQSPGGMSATAAAATTAKGAYMVSFDVRCSSKHWLCVLLCWAMLHCEACLADGRDGAQLGC